MNATCIDAKLINALASQNKERPPVWIMRQAGRYLPEYQILRKKYSLRDLFFHPELAAEVTRMPVDLLGFDAAILFSDIMVIAVALGLKLDFVEGPVLQPLLTPSILDGLSYDLSQLEPMIQAIRLLIPDLKVPLLGFCGAPFTVATYLIEKHAGEKFTQTKQWLYGDPKSFTKLLSKIEKISIAYLKMQVEAGVSAVQIFDSWANILSKEDFRRFCLPVYQRMIEAVKVPVILFMRGAAVHLEDLASLNCTLSLDWQIPISEARLKTKQPLQGNLDPDLLYAPLPLVKQKTKELLDSMKRDPGFIVNLGHGIKPNTPVEAVRCLIETVQQER
jgi:uroporphyrinogen decarboxylase